MSLTSPVNRLLVASALAVAAVSGAGAQSALVWGFDLAQPRSAPARVWGLGGVAAVAYGQQHALAVLTDGSVWGWGGNAAGELTADASQPIDRPIRIPGVSGAIAVACGASHSMALLADGTVMAWGSNLESALGLPTGGTKVPPTAVPGLAGVTSIACGRSHSLAVTSDGSVWSWGLGGDGQLGHGDNQSGTTPRRISGLPPALAVAGGGYHSVAVLADGALAAWGANWSGQLGDGKASARELRPKIIPGSAWFKTISCYNNHSLAVTRDGHVYSWGDNEFGQLGDGTTTERDVPTLVPGLHSVASVSTSYSHSMFVQIAGGMYACGANDYGQLGDGTVTDQYAPVEVTAIASGTACSAAHSASLAVSADGALWSWGLGYDGLNSSALGRPAPPYLRHPNYCRMASSIASVTASYHILALMHDGTVRAAGWNWSGQLGDGTTTASYDLKEVTGLAGVRRVAAGTNHSLALLNDGRVMAWGGNSFGQLGDGTQVGRDRPVVVSGLTDAIAIAAGEYFSVAVRADGTVWAWGYGTDGQTGSVSGGWRTTPAAVSGVTGVTAVAAGRDFCLALRTGGDVWAWGNNSDGQLGDPSFSSWSTWVPGPVVGLSAVSSIACGTGHALALRADGAVFAWGDNTFGQLGQGTSSWQGSSHVQAVPGLAGVAAIAAGGDNSLALGSDGSVTRWGRGYLGTALKRATSPVLLYGVAPVTSVATGRDIGIVLGHQVPSAIIVARAAGRQGTQVGLTATLTSGTTALFGRSVRFSVDGTEVGSATTDPTGVAGLTMALASFARRWYDLTARYDGDGATLPCDASAPLEVSGEATSLYTIDRTAIIGTPTILRAYLRRTFDSAAIDGVLIRFRADGTTVGYSTTGSGGMPGNANLNWTVTPGVPTRILRVDFAGGSVYDPCFSQATLTATTTHTKVYVVDRTTKVKTYTVLKAYLFTPSNTAIAGKPMVIDLDGTRLASGATNSAGCLQVGYTVAEGVGVGVRTIRGEFAGDGGCMASANTGKLTVTAGDLYIWPYVRSGKRGTNHPLKAYVRSLPDYVIQPGKSIKFKVNGSDVGTGSVAADGWASATWAIPAGEATGPHTAAAEFAGDSWYKAVTATTSFTVVP